VSTEPTAIDESSAVALVAAAAATVGPCAPDAWDVDQVRQRAFDLLRLVPVVVERSAVLAACRPVTGVIAQVEEVKGRGVITFHATMGVPQPKQEVVDGRGVEYLRTEWLNERAGRALFDQARSLRGRHCRFGKRTEQLTASKAVSMVEWIEDLGPDPKATGPAPHSRAIAPQSDAIAAPAPRATPAGTTPEDDPFRPFDASDELLAGIAWARSFGRSCSDAKLSEHVRHAIIDHATSGRVRSARAVRKDETTAVWSIFKAVTAGRLAPATVDGAVVLVAAASNGTAA
jgi:hypothetical protein